jgi:hypothetical protein
MKHLVGGLFFSGVVAFGLLTGCYTDDSTVGGDNPDDGAECGVIGERVTQSDGCTECTCTEMGWACDDSTCNPVGCTDGASRPAGDGCNTCYCQEGEWSCTLIDCQPQCTPGEMDSDGCTSCWCSETGEWTCTANYCPPQCDAGEVREAGDGCNRCTCTADGTWACTMENCNNCGFLDQAAPDPCNECECLEDGTVVCTPVPGCMQEECPPPVMVPEDMACPAVSGVARNPTTGKCCEYATACTAPADWPLYGTLSECEMGIVCEPGTGDCDGDPANGCEANLESDVQNCGGCGLVCMLPPDATIACVEGACQITSIPRDTCVYGGVEYQPGQEFPSRDGCNTCSCMDETGPTTSIVCTDAACACDPENEPYRHYVSDSPDTCALIDYACTDNTTHFTNECGCGCEQSTECPETIDCTPMSGSCNEPLAARCPYTVVSR